MTAHEDESAGQNASKTDDGAVSTAEADEKNDENSSGVRDTTEKPEPDEGAKEKAKEMMSAYEDKPTLVMPGSGKTITGTAVNEWLDDDGNPKYAEDEDSPAAKARSESKESKDSEGTEATNETDKADESREKGHQKGDAGDNEGDGGGRAKNTAESERAAEADENAEDENKSMDQLREEAEQRVKDNMDKDKDFNKEIIEATKKDREEREKADK